MTMNIINRLRFIIMTAISIACLNACDDNNDAPLYFAGDSIVARWDLQNSFSSLITYNQGISGSGVAYLESLSGQFAGRKAVVLSGTNDYTMYPNADAAESYAERYVGALTATGASRIYLFPILPRRFGNDPADVNKRIKAVNRCISALVAGESRFVYIDVFDTFADGDGIRQQYYQDGLHLSPYGYEVLSNSLSDKLNLSE